MPPIPAADSAVQHAECAICFEPLHTLPVSTLCGLLRAAPPPPLPPSAGLFGGIFGSSRAPDPRPAMRERVCRHYFHTPCIEAIQNRKCPICRTDFTRLQPLPNPLVDPQGFFSVLDEDKSGALEIHELLEGCKAALNLDHRRIDNDVSRFYSLWDSDKNGSVNFDEFSRNVIPYLREHYPGVAAAPIPDLQSNKRAWFTYWDQDGSGALSKGEVHRALVKTFRLEDGAVEVSSVAVTLENVWAIFDSDGSGEIDVDEFTQRDGLGDTIIASMMFRE